MITVSKILKEELENNFPSRLVDVGAKEDNITASLPAFLIVPGRENSQLTMLGHRKNSAIDLEVILSEYHIPNQLIQELELIEEVKQFILANERIKQQIVNVESVNTSYKIVKDSVNDLNGIIQMSLTFRINKK